MSEYPVLERLMKSAYDRYQANPNWSATDFHAQLTPAETIAVHIGNMNYQVGNGGWSQWFDNGYGRRPGVFTFIVFQLNKMETPNAKTVIKLMTLAMKRQSFITEAMENDESWEPVYQEALDLFGDVDSLYYLVDDDFLGEVEEFIIKEFPELTNG